MGGSSRPGVGIITATPIECYAVQAVLDELRRGRAADPADRASYWFGSMPGADGRPHRVVLSLLPEDGGIAAAHGCANLQRSWRVEQVVMCGIACGVPRPDDPARHVRLGDILVAEDGIVPYGHVRAMRGGREELRRPAPQPSVVLKNAARVLRVGSEGGHRPWEQVLASRGRAAEEDYSRPAPNTDVLLDDEDMVIPHPLPVESGHRHGQPKVSYGWLGSGGKLIKTAAERNRLADEYRLIGFDMEGDGVSDAAYLQHVEWFSVRGVSDYGSGKNDLWHRYAALAAASYIRALLGAVDPILAPGEPGDDRRPAEVNGDRPRPVDADQRRSIVDAAWQVRTMRDRPGRDRVAAALARESGVRIPRARDPDSDVEGIVLAAGRIPDGLSSLVRVLRAIERDSTPLNNLERLLREGT